MRRSMKFNLHRRHPLRRHVTRIGNSKGKVVEMLAQEPSMHLIENLDEKIRIKKYGLH